MNIGARAPLNASVRPRGNRDQRRFRSDQGIECPAVQPDISGCDGCGFRLFCILGAVDAQSRKFQFAAIGDTGYTKRGEQEFDHVMAAMNREPLTFIVHVGDL